MLASISMSAWVVALCYDPGPVIAACIVRMARSNVRRSSSRAAVVSGKTRPSNPSEMLVSLGLFAALKPLMLGHLEIGASP